jgi:hypothetical protein
MSFLQSVRDTVVRDKARTMLQEEPLKDGRSGRASGETGRHRLNKEPRLKTGATSGEQENTRQDLQKDRRVEGRKANSQDPLRNERKHGTQSMNHKCRITYHSRNFWPHQPEEDDGNKPGPARALSGSRSRRAALRREERERLESKQRKTEPR